MVDQAFIFHDDLIQMAKATLLQIEQQHQANVAHRSSMMQMHKVVMEKRGITPISDRQHGKSNMKRLSQSKKRMNNRTSLIFVGIHSR